MSIADHNHVARAVTIFHQIQGADQAIEASVISAGRARPVTDEQQLVLLTRRVGQVVEATFDRDDLHLAESLRMLGADVFRWLDQIEVRA